MRCLEANIFKAVNSFTQSKQKKRKKKEKKERIRKREGEREEKILIIRPPRGKPQAPPEPQSGAHGQRHRTPPTCRPARMRTRASHGEAEEESGARGSREVVWVASGPGGHCLCPQDRASQRVWGHVADDRTEKATAQRLLPGKGQERPPAVRGRGHTDHGAGGG